MDPGTVNTKMLIDNWGQCGIDIDKASDTFELATDEKYSNPGNLPKYYVDLKESKSTEQALN